MKFRLVKLDDAETLRNIYAPYVEKTAITFEYDVPSVDEFKQRIKEIAAQFPYLVAVDEFDHILGYAYAHTYSERKAYDWVAELSVYVGENARGQHVGSELYQRLFSLLKAQNYQRVYACITADNAQSHRFHEKFGFERIGVMTKVGYKFGKWLDVEWMDELRMLLQSTN